MKPSSAAQSATHQKIIQTAANEVRRYKKADNEVEKSNSGR